MSNHNPIEITCPFPPDRGAGGVPYIPKNPALYLPEPHAEQVPLLVRITSGEDISGEIGFFQNLGFALLQLDTDQIGTEREPEAVSGLLNGLSAQLDLVLSENPVLDRDFLFLDGWLTAPWIFQTQKFRAAVQRPALIEPASACGNCPAGTVEPFGETLSDMLHALTDRSVLMEIDNCKTPCLVLHIPNSRYSAEQSELLYSAMKDRNPDVPCRLAVFPEAASEQRIRQEVADWLHRFSSEVNHE